MPAYKPDDIHALFEHAFNSADVDAVVALYEPLAVLVVDGRKVVGHDGIRKSYEGFFLQRARMTLETRTVIESGEGLAMLYGSWVIQPLEPEASGVTTRGISTEVVRRQPDGTWLFAIDIPHTPG